MTRRKLPVRFTGQHFTIDKTLISDSVRLAGLRPSDVVLDIGAGKGFLTIHLIKHSKQILAIEKDADLALYLKQKFRHYPQLAIVHSDFQHVRLPDRPFKVVSNIPYGLTSGILKTLMFENLGRFTGGTVIMQLESAKKLVAKAIFNPYIVFYRTFYDLKLHYEINPSSFMPPPTVKSALVCIRPHSMCPGHIDKIGYLRFLQKLLKAPECKFRTALKTVFRKSQIRTFAQRHSVNLEVSLERVHPFVWKLCYDEMVREVPEKFHP